MTESIFQIRQFIINWVVSSSPMDTPLAVDAECNLVEEGYIDSLGFLSLIAALEIEFSIEIDFGELSPEEFTTISGLTESVLRSLK